MSAANEYLSELLNAYEHEPIDKFHRRLASWRGGADHTVLLWATLLEVRTLNERIAALAADGPKETR